jgi:hypothetical protein
MSNPTSNFNWQMPTAADLVTDLPADFETFGQAVDTSLADLKGGTSGQILSKASNTDMDFTWVTNDVGDITAVTAGTGITGGGTSGAVTVSLDQTNFGGGQNAAGKNALLNGSMDWWQRGTSIVATGGPLYTADRWGFYRSSSGTGCTVSRQTSGLAGFQYAARIQRDSGNTATTVLNFYYSMESQDAYKYVGKVLTLSFYARKGANYSSTSSALSVQVQTGTGTNQNVIYGYTGATDIANSPITLTTTWTRYTITTSAVGSTATEIGIVFGNTPVGTAGAADYYEITGVQLEAAAVASPFQTAMGTLQGELEDCQRYYEAITYASGTMVSTAQAQSTSAAYAPLTWKVTKRSTPTISIPIGGLAFLTLNGGSALATSSFNTISVDSARIDGTSATGLVAGNASSVQAIGATTIAISSEL